MEYFRTGDHVAMWVLWFWDRQTPVGFVDKFRATTSTNFHGGLVWNCPTNGKIEVASNKFSIGTKKGPTLFPPLTQKPPWRVLRLGDHELSQGPRGTAFITVLGVGDLCWSGHGIEICMNLIYQEVHPPQKTQESDVFFYRSFWEFASWNWAMEDDDMP